MTDRQSATERNATECQIAKKSKNDWNQPNSENTLSVSLVRLLR